MKICLLMDEISNDPETAIELAAAWGMHDFELRGFYTDRVPRFSEFQRQRLHDALDEYGARIVALAPGLFKIPCPVKRSPRESLGWMDRPGYESWAEARRKVGYHLDELLPASLDYAHELGAGVIVIFAFHRAGEPPGEPPDEVLNYLRLAAERAGAAGMNLALENDEGLWVDSGARCAQLVRTINHPALGINWDPANSFFAGYEPYPADYQNVRGLVRHMHFKDARRDQNGTPHLDLEGDVDWAGQINTLVADGYQGFISIETHLRPKVSGTRTLLERVRTLVASARENKEA